jgi:imidazolonepropionase-like amidohydrolase
MPSGSLRIRSRRVWSGAHACTLAPAVVTVRDGVIEQVEPDDGQSRADLPEVDLGDSVLLPGFIDVHAHLTLPADGRTYEAVHTLADGDLLEIGRANALRHLRGGVTTVRDNGARADLGTMLRSELAAQMIAPRVLVAGRPLTPPGGHFHFCGGTAATVTDIREAVRRLADEGVDHIKVMASGGGTAGSRPEESTYSLAHLRAATATAHALGLPVTAHCRGTESLRLAVRAEVDCVEHADFLAPLPGADAVMAYDAEVAAMLRNQGTWISMTLQAGGYDTLLELAGDPAAHPAEVGRLQRYFAAKLRILERLLHDGLEDQIVISTDAGPADTRFGRIGWGLALASAIGWKPTESLRAVTSRAAAVLGLGGRAGQIVAGCSADFVAVGPELFDEEGATAHVRWVMTRGREVPMPEPGGSY